MRWADKGRAEPRSEAIVCGYVDARLLVRILRAFRACETARAYAPATLCACVHVCEYLSVCVCVYLCVCVYVITTVA